MADRPSLESMIEAMNAPRRRARAIKGSDLAPVEANEMAETFWRAEDRELLIAARAEVAASKIMPLSAAEVHRVRINFAPKKLYRWDWFTAPQTAGRVPPPKEAAIG